MSLYTLIDESNKSSKKSTTKLLWCQLIYREKGILLINEIHPLLFIHLDVWNMVLSRHWLSQNWSFDNDYN